MIAQLGAQPVSVQLSHDREGDGRFHDGADALGAWGRRIPLAAGLLQGAAEGPQATSSIPARGCGTASTTASGTLRRKTS